MGLHAACVDGVRNGGGADAETAPMAVGTKNPRVGGDCMLLELGRGVAVGWLFQDPLSNDYAADAGAAVGLGDLQTWPVWV